MWITNVNTIVMIVNDIANSNVFVVTEQVYSIT